MVDADFDAIVDNELWIIQALDRHVRIQGDPPVDLWLAEYVDADPPVVREEGHKHRPVSGRVAPVQTPRGTPFHTDNLTGVPSLPRIAFYLRGMRQVEGRRGIANLSERYVIHVQADVDARLRRLIPGTERRTELVTSADEDGQTLFDERVSWQMAYDEAVRIERLVCATLRRRAIDLEVSDFVPDDDNPTRVDYATRVIDATLIVGAQTL